MKFLIGKATINDTNAIVELNKQFHLDMKDFIWDTEEWIKKEIELGNYYVAKNDDLVIGAFNIQPHDRNILSLETIAVNSDMHGKGISRIILDFVKNYCKKNSYNNLIVETFVDYNLLNFYKKIGFKLDNPPQDVFNGKSYYRFIMTID